MQQVESKPAPTVDSPKRLDSLTIFFPCYNEEANVVPMTEAAIAAGQQVTDDLEVLIVNDGSRDNTEQLADELAAKYPEVRAVHNKPNRGYGGALIRGFTEATKDYVFYTDGDRQFDISEIVRLIPLLDQYDIVSGYRLNRRDSSIRKLNAHGWEWLVNTVLGMHLRDIDGAFKLYPRRFLDEIELWSQGAAIDAEMLAKATRLGYRIGQIGVQHYPRTVGEQTGGNIKVILKGLLGLNSLRRRIKSIPKRTLG
jgi:glycosyltransferase involved in cell wall biosynthesis